MDDVKEGTCCAARARRRHAAGEDPAKRAQILKGAMQEFLEKGFDATSMNEIARAAGVSKGTIYVYFADKVELFEALIAEERERMFEGLETLLEGDLSLRDKLIAFGTTLAQILCSDHVIRAQRIVAAIVDRMPEVGVRFYETGALRTHRALTALFEREIAAGHLAMPDARLAGFQFMELASAGLWRPRLFGRLREAPSAAEIDATVLSAVAMFLQSYGVDEA
jgi:AcrR family transcriptional regulator